MQTMHVVGAFLSSREQRGGLLFHHHHHHHHHYHLIIIIIIFIYKRLKKKLLVCYAYSLTSPFGHLYYGWFVWSQKCQKSYIPYLYNTDTSVKQTLGSAPLVSVLKRFDCTEYSDSKTISMEL